MKRKVCVVDTNIVVSGLIGSSTGPPARILRAMLGGGMLYLMSSHLLAEYSSVLRRPKIARLHGRTDGEINHLLADMVASAIWREPVDGGTAPAPDTGDNHLWALLAVHPQSLLVTGDRLLIDNPPSGASVVSPRRFVDAFLPT
jgi:putative PIN family toxin of toxin-antitoxin system